MIARQDANCALKHGDQSQPSDFDYADLMGPNPETSQPAGESPSKGLRWWPAIVLLAIYGLTLLTVWVLLDDIDLQRGIQVIVTYIATGVSVLGLLIWELFFARLRSPWWGRVQIGIVLVVATLFGLFRIDHADGDAWFTFNWRWAEDPHVALNPNIQLAPDADPVIPNPETDYPGFLGANRDGIVSGVSFTDDWEANPPRELWRIEPGKKTSLGAGFSSFAIVGDQAYTQELRGQEEYVSCWGLKTGELIWRNAQTDAKDAVVFESNVAGDGPRATPTFHDGRVYAIGSSGVLSCFNAASGDRIWSADVFEQTESQNMQWGYSSSPLIAEPHVIVSAGGVGKAQLVGYRLDTTDKHPEPAVFGGDGTKGGMDFYDSPSLQTVCGVPQILHINNEGIVAFEPVTLDVLWRHPWPWMVSHPFVAQPIALPDNHVFVSAAYLSGNALIQVTGSEDGEYETELVWSSNTLKSKFANVLVQGDYIYGLDARILTCINWRTGKREWKVRAGTFGHGQILLAGDVIIVQAETGELVFVKATPERYEELARLQPFEDRTWNNPALSGKYLLLRNHLEAACYELTLGRESEVDPVD